MIVGIAKASDGVIILPEELKGILGDAENVLVIEQENGLYLKRIDRPRKRSLIEIAEKLSALDKSNPITLEELEAEITAARAEKRARRESRP